MYFTIPLIYIIILNRLGVKSKRQLPEQKIVFRVGLVIRVIGWLSLLFTIFLLRMFLKSKSLEDQIIIGGMILVFGLLSTFFILVGQMHRVCINKENVFVISYLGRIEIISFSEIDNVSISKFGTYYLHTCSNKKVRIDSSLTGIYFLILLLEEKCRFRTESIITEKIREKYPKFKEKLRKEFKYFDQIYPFSD